jgi:hypothetical protein
MMTEDKAMAEFEYVRRKSDGWYVSVDSGFTPDRRAKGFVFHEGAAKSIGPFLTGEYEIVPLPDDEAKEFRLRSEL